MINRRRFITQTATVIAGATVLPFLDACGGGGGDSTNLGLA